MAFTGFKKKDFNVFKIDGLENRMEAIQSRIQPKFEALSKKIQPELSSLTGDEMYIHIARHARRTINPPEDTWVAFADNRRGYKQHPHFQIGLWNTHLFIWFAMIYESPFKKEAAAEYMKNADEIYNRIPNDYFWSEDHMKPGATPQSELSSDAFKHLITRLENVKKAELLCGRIIPKDEAVQLNAKELTKIILDTYKTVLPLYTMAKRNSDIRKTGHKNRPVLFCLEII